MKWLSASFPTETLSGLLQIRPQDVSFFRNNKPAMFSVSCLSSFTSSLCWPDTTVQNLKKKKKKNCFSIISSFFGLVVSSLLKMLTNTEFCNFHHPLPWKQSKMAAKQNKLVKVCVKGIVYLTNLIVEIVTDAHYISLVRRILSYVALCIF